MSYILSGEQHVYSPSIFCSVCGKNGTFDSIEDFSGDPKGTEVNDDYFYFYQCPGCSSLVIVKVPCSKMIKRGYYNDNEEDPIFVFNDSDAEIIYPIAMTGPEPAMDMPEDIRADYNEARTVAQFSPRAAAALLRLALEKLCENITGEKEKDINTTIEKLVAQGLPTKLQKAFDIVRITGNKSVHPGELNLNDNPDIVEALWKLINIIVEKMITEPKEIDELYEQMPESDRAKVAKRDGKAKA